MRQTKTGKIAAVPRVYNLRCHAWQVDGAVRIEIHQGAIFKSSLTGMERNEGGRARLGCDGLRGAGGLAVQAGIQAGRPI